MASSVLVVEDSLVLQQVLIKLLNRLGLESDGADNGAIAIEKFKANRDYKLILMDIMMPEVDGLKATQEIRAFEKTEGLTRVPIVAVTCVEDHKTCIDAGMDDYYQKPLRLNQLEEIIKKWA